ncbi:hypothetical protein F3J14_09795 [Burkholderia sp. Tr-862]|uniref:hypothetical protein n=1 Tax=Burkholderia sp. Tr-862 TaxID=2608331 RepID=UPI0014191F9F|nr:hypothetical protein [Burkholderia sp. Tr-862]NIF41173.1 hypothetical protein [Burkholderia sp. Tr-862]
MSGIPTTLPGSLRYIQPAEAPKLEAELKSHLKPPQKVDSPKNQLVSPLIRTRLNFGIYEGSPGFDVIAKMFQKKFVRVPPQPSPRGGPAAAMALHENETWQYQQVDGQLERAITIASARPANLTF